MGGLTTFCVRMAAVVAFSGIGIHLALNNLTCLHALDVFLDKLQGGAEFNKRNPFVTGNYAPVGEESTNVEVKILSGKVPEGLEGLFLRVGPNPIPQHGHTKRIHWFDGVGMLHTVRLKKGQTPTYNNAYLNTPRYRVEIDRGEDFMNNIGELVGWTGLIKVMTLMGKKAALLGIPKYTDGQANTAMVVHNKAFYCLHEGSIPFRVHLYDDGTFTSLGHSSWSLANGTLDFATSAHPKVDPITGELLFHGYSLFPRGPQFKYGELSADGALKTYFGVHTTDGKGPFAHDMAISEKWSILNDGSVKFEGKRIVEGKSVFHFKDDINARWGLIPRGKATSEDDVIWFEADKPYLVVHTLNAWDEGDDVVLYTPISESFDGDLGVDNDDAVPNTFYLAEVRFDVSEKTVKVTRVSDYQESVEFPLIHPQFMGRKSKYGFVGTMAPQDGQFMGFGKFELKPQGSYKTITYGEGRSGGEAILMPKPKPTKKEGDGSDACWVGIFIFDANTGLSEFVVYDGESMDPTPVVRMEIPRRVPFGFHGHWIPEGQLQDVITQNNLV